MNVLLPAGCGSTPSVTPASGPRTDEAAPSGATTAPAPRAAALVNGVSVEWSELRPLVVETSGGAILEEIVLDRRLAVEAAAQGVAVTDADVARERQVLLESLSPDPNVAVRLLEELRRRQQLGPERFDRLLRRNAMLRALVADEVRITPETVRQAHELATGPRRQVRLATLPSIAECERLRQRALAGESFGDLAVELSTDASALRGGLLEPFARGDVSYPEVLRAAAFAAAPGEVTPPILLDSGYAVLRIEREIPGTSAALEPMREQLERSVRIAQERVLMDQLARRLLAEARVTVIDEDLEASWRMRSTAPRGRP